MGSSSSILLTYLVATHINTHTPYRFAAFCCIALSLLFFSESITLSDDCFESLYSIDFVHLFGVLLCLHHHYRFLHFSSINLGFCFLFLFFLYMCDSGSNQLLLNSSAAAGFFDHHHQQQQQTLTLVNGTLKCDNSSLVMPTTISSNGGDGSQHSTTSSSATTTAPMSGNIISSLFFFFLFFPCFLFLSFLALVYHIDPLRWIYSIDGSLIESIHSFFLLRESKNSSCDVAERARVDVL